MSSKFLGLGCAFALVAMVAAPAWADIESIQAAGIPTTYAGGNGNPGNLGSPLVMSAAPIPVLTINYDDRPPDQYTNVPGTTIDLVAYLIADHSVSGWAMGDFSDYGGQQSSVLVTWDQYSLAGTNLFIRLWESSPNVIEGSGRFIVDEENSNLPAEWNNPDGSIASFSIPAFDAPDIVSFIGENAGWEATSLVTLVPNGSGIPEPATLSLLAIPALVALRRRR